MRTEAKVKEKRLEKKLEQAKKDIKEAEKTGNRKKLRKATNKTKQTQQELSQTRKTRDAAEKSLKKGYAVGTVVFEMDTAEASETLAEKLVMARPKSLQFSVVSIDPEKIILKAVAKE